MTLNYFLNVNITAIGAEQASGDRDADASGRGAEPAGSVCKGETALHGARAAAIADASSAHEKVQQ